MTRVRSIDASQIISTGLVNLRRFEQRNSETLIVGELFDRRMRLLDGSGDAVIEDVAIEQRRSGDWGVTELFVSRVSSSSSTWRRRSRRPSSSTGTRRCSPPTMEPQAATAFVANHENSKPADLADAIHEMSDKRMVEIAAELQDERLADVLQELPPRPGADSVAPGRRACRAGPRRDGTGRRRRPAHRTGRRPA